MKRCWKKHNFQGHVEYIIVCTVASCHYKPPWFTTAREIHAEFRAVLNYYYHGAYTGQMLRKTHRKSYLSVHNILYINIIYTICSGTASPTTVGITQNSCRFFYFSFPSPFSLYRKTL